MFSECVLGVCFQERSLSCVKQMAVGDPLLSIPVYASICSSILVRVYSCFSELNAWFFFFSSFFKQRCTAAAARLSHCH